MGFSRLKISAASYVWILIAVFFCKSVHAECVGLISGPMILDVIKCTAINPEAVFSRSNPSYSFIYDLPEADKNNYLNSYRGLYIRAKVQSSEANKGTFDPSKGVLTGEMIKAFIPPGSLTCSAIDQRRIKVKMDEKCCDGAGSVPCLLETSYFLDGATVISSKANSKFSGRKVPDYVKPAKQALQKQQYDQVVDLLNPIFQANQLELSGLVMLGAAYRQLDMCGKAEKPLARAYSLYLKKQYWEEDSPLIRKAVFLHARCLAKEKKVAASVEVLQSMLFAIDLFRDEVSQSLSHPDFGWIRTSKEYLQYVKAAQKKLGSK